MNLNVKHHFAQVNGINLHYTKQGKGKKLVVLLHGWPEFWYSWRYQIPALAEDFTVIAPDLRGFADSDKPLDIKEYHPSIVASDIAKLIASLGFEKAFIVGHDWGGAIAWAFASYYPDLTEKLVVLNCPHPQLFVKALSSNMEQIKKSWYMFFFQIPKVPELFLGNTLQYFFKQFMRGWMYNPQNMSDEDLAKYVQAYSHKNVLTTSINYYRNAVGNALSNIIFRKTKTADTRLPKISAPVLVIWGKNDKALGVELNDNLENYLSSDFEIKYVDNCSHWIQMDQPEIVNKHLIQFLKA